MTFFAPVGNGRVIAYFFGEDLEYVRGTNVLRAGSDTFAAVGDEIVRPGPEGRDRRWTG